MNNHSKFFTIFLGVFAIAMLIIPAISAQGCGDSLTAKWIAVQQQYNPSYTPQIDASCALSTEIEVPQWVLDRHQYETTFLYVPIIGDYFVPDVVSDVPQWVMDRQQYETSFVYEPILDAPSAPIVVSNLSVDN